MARIQPITIDTPNVNEIANLREIVDDINQCIDWIQNTGGERVAEIIREMGQRILTGSRLEKQALHVVMENVRMLAWEASLPREDRRLRATNAALSYIPPLLITSLDVLDYFQAHLEDLKKFFDIPG